MFPGSYDTVCLLAGSHMSRVRVSVTSYRQMKQQTTQNEISSNLEPRLTPITTSSSFVVTCLFKNQKNKTKQQPVSLIVMLEKLQNTEQDQDIQHDIHSDLISQHLYPVELRGFRVQTLVSAGQSLARRLCIDQSLPNLNKISSSHTQRSWYPIRWG